ncbi:hypothetical protein QBC42DRAFT_268537, partial [Cladorrhinum samala]
MMPFLFLSFFFFGFFLFLSPTMSRARSLLRYICPPFALWTAKSMIFFVLLEMSDYFPPPVILSIDHWACL